MVLKGPTQKQNPNSLKSELWLLPPWAGLEKSLPYTQTPLHVLSGAGRTREAKGDPTTANGAGKHLERSSLEIWAGRAKLPSVAGDIDQPISICPISQRSSLTSILAPSRCAQVPGCFRKRDFQVSPP